MARKKKPEAIICNYCPEDEVNETVEGETEDWKQSEYGIMCPECRFVRGMDDDSGSSVGLDPLAQVTESAKGS
jgi:hypothetical protein